MHHGTEFTIVLVAIAALGVGAATRALLRHTKIPYTVALLLLGFLVGALLRGPGPSHAERGVVGELVGFAASITPDLIIFVFLPALIFESAFSLEAYGFRKNLGPIVLLAVVGLIASTVLTAFATVALTAGSWCLSLSAALVFGALISATDPVAVVAILRELGAPKRLAMLIEGESLMNDGTAIVLFNVLLGSLVAGSGTIDVAHATLDFMRVVAGGVGVGVLLGATTSAWLSRTFNDPLVEITLTLVLAYAAMAIAEGLLHVSGVMALVSAGLWMSSVGRPRISPEVQHFLHQFWQMLAYVANTLIFILVGVLVGSQVHLAGWGDALLVAGAYLLVMLIRFAVTFALLPLMNRMGDPITGAQATVMSWGGLRGAVSLALSLVICQHPDLPPTLQRELLLMTAGVAFLTIVLNGSSAAWLLARFGFDRPAVGQELVRAGTRARVLSRVQARIAELSADLKTVDWSEVERDLAGKRGAAESQLSKVREQLARAGQVERAAGLHQQVLSVERQAYWSLFGQGIVSARALRVLSRELDMQEDRLGRGDVEPPQSRLPMSDDWLARGARLLRKARLDIGNVPFEHLTLLYDLARAITDACGRVLEVIDMLEDGDLAAREALTVAYRRYAVEGRERLEDLRTHLPEMTQAIETRLARRIELNLERDDYRRLAREGVIEEQAAGVMLDEVEAEMKRLLLSPTEMALPETAELCRRAPLFSALDAAALEQLAELTDERVFSAGEVLFRQGERGQSMFVIARGAVHVLREDRGQQALVDVLGGGDILGEMALLTGQPRNATIRAATTVTVGEVTRASFDRLMQSQPHLREGVWHAVLRRQLANHLRAHAELPQPDRGELEAWTASVRLQHLGRGEALACGQARYLFVVDGTCSLGGRLLDGPALCELAGHAQVTAASGEAALALLDEPPSSFVRPR